MSTLSNDRIITVYKVIQSINGLKLECSVTGTYDLWADVEDNKYWTSVTGSDVTENWHVEVTRLDSVESSTAEILDDNNTIVEQNWEATLQHYILVGIPGTHLVIPTPTSKQSVSGTVRHKI